MHCNYTKQFFSYDVEYLLVLLHPFTVSCSLAWVHQEAAGSPCIGTLSVQCSTWSSECNAHAHKSYIGQHHAGHVCNSFCGVFYSLLVINAMSKSAEAPQIFFTLLLTQKISYVEIIIFSPFFLKGAAVSAPVDKHHKMLQDSQGVSVFEFT